MAQFSGSFYSKNLTRKVPFTAIIPTQSELELIHGENKPEFSQPKRTLYLLHGWDGSNEDWLFNSRIYELAREYNVAVILPSGENSFYLDHPNGNAYGQFIGEELVEVTRELFFLSSKREDTWIAGLSMGGYGALRNGFKYSNTFSKVAAFSSRILSKKEAPHREELEENFINEHIKAIIRSDTLADLSEEDDVYDLVTKRTEEQKVFIACGFEDYLYEENRAFHEFLLKNKILHEYFESSGGHTWDFWNEYIRKAVKWMTENH
ncbi:MAG TPA: alpha/beta hydrolase-fold protein [Atopostipes sp.]|nr:alpha/beta hydrolase-fold protein [Atopostipes sp.]